MARGFGTTLGVGATDRLTTNYSKSGSDKRSYAIWFLGAGSIIANSRIFDKGGSAGFSEILLFDGSGKLAFDRANASNVFTAHHELSGYSIGIDAWTHITVTHDQSGGLAAPSFFVNGDAYSAVSISAVGNGAANDTAPFVVGNRDSGDRGVSGGLAHFAIWDGVLLDAGSVAALAAGESPLAISPANLVLYMPLDGIHNPEWDAINFTSASITGTAFVNNTSGRVPMYFPAHGTRRRPFALSSGGGAGGAPMISIIW